MSTNDNGIDINIFSSLQIPTSTALHPALKNIPLLSTTSSTKHSWKQVFTIFRNSSLDYFYFDLLAEPHSSVCSIQDFRIGGRWFDLRLGQCSFQGLMIVIATESRLPLLFIDLTMATWKSSQWLRKNIVRNTGKKNSRKA